MITAPRSSLLAVGLLLAPAAFAQDEAPEAPEAPESPATAALPTSADRQLESMDRFFPLSESASTPPADIRAETNGSANGGGEGTQGLGVSQSVEVVLLKGLSLRAGADLHTNQSGFTPVGQVKYQFLNQKQHGLNLSAGGRYKQTGFQSDRGEVEVFAAVGKRWGHLLGTANAVVGVEPSRNEGDAEAHVGVAYLLTERFVVGANTRYQQEFETGAKLAGHSGREFELTSGAMAGYSLGPVDASLLAGWYLPRATMETGPIAMLRIGVNL